MSLFLAILLATGPVSSWTPPDTTDKIQLSVAITLIGIDVAQTVHFTSKGIREMNPLLGEHPSTARIILQGGLLSAALVGGAWYCLPKEYRPWVPMFVIGMEGYAVFHNFEW